MQIRNTLIALICLSFSLSVQAQTDSSTTKNISFKSKKTVNFTKLELVYQTETVRYTGASYGASGYRLPRTDPSLPYYSAPTITTVNVPYIRINGGELKRVDKHANVLRPLLYKSATGK